MMKKIRGAACRIYILIFLFPVFSLILSCEAIPDYVEVAAGNYSFEQGAYQQANYRYLKALESGLYRDYVAYNLGNVYHDLGAMDSALLQWESVEENADRDLRFRIAFNRGVLHYGRGDYNRAFTEFRKAILIQPTRKKKSSLLAAKRNLELCLQKLNLEEGSVDGNGGEGRVPGRKRLERSTLQMLEMVRERERLNWERAQGAEILDVEDY